MSISRTLLLMRHGETEEFRPGRPDADRALTEYGRTQAAAVGEYLRTERLAVDQVLCSTATRTRQTLEELGVLGRVDYAESIYNAGSDTILGALHEVAPAIMSILVIGHAPGIPALAHDLADPETSNAEAVQAIEHRFPSSTLVRLEFSGSWGELTAAALTAVRLPRS